MPYQEKPLLPEIASTEVGEKVVLEDVTVTNEIWRGGKNDTIVLFGVERGGSEGVVKTFDGTCPTSGTSITVVGKKSEYNGKFSIEVNTKFGGGIAYEGEPLHTAQPTQAAAPQQSAPPTSNGKMTVSEYRDLMKNSLEYWGDNAPAPEDVRPLAVSEMIATLRKDIIDHPGALPF